MDTFKDFEDRGSLGSQRGSFLKFRERVVF